MRSRSRAARFVNSRLTTFRFSAEAKSLRGRGQVVMKSKPWACLRPLRRVDLSINRPSLLRKNACQNFEAGLLWMLAIKCLLAGLEKRHRIPHTANAAANINAIPSISTVFRFVDFEAFTIHLGPPISTLLKYEIKSLLQPAKVFRANVRWTGKSSKPRNVVRRRIQKRGLSEVDHWRGIDMEHGHSV